MQEFHPAVIKGIACFKEQTLLNNIIMYFTYKRFKKRLYLSGLIATATHRTNTLAAPKSFTLGIGRCSHSHSLNQHFGCAQEFHARKRPVKQAQ